jgi:hypothetical protein
MLLLVSDIKDVNGIKRCYVGANVVDNNLHDVVVLDDFIHATPIASPEAALLGCKQCVNSV